MSENERKLLVYVAGIVLLLLNPQLDREKTTTLRRLLDAVKVDHS